MKKSVRQYLNDIEREAEMKKKAEKMKEKLYKEFMETEQLKKIAAMDRKNRKAPQCSTRQHPAVRKRDRNVEDRIARQEGFIDFCKFRNESEAREARKRYKLKVPSSMKKESSHRSKEEEEDRESGEEEEGEDARLVYNRQHPSSPLLTTQDELDRLYLPP